MSSTPEIAPSIPTHNADQPNDSIVESMAAVTDEIYNSMQLIEAEPGWNEAAQRVVVVLSASRSGSSLLFKALSSSEDVIAPAGEHEPWLFMSGNKYPFTASDGMTEVQNRGRLLHLLRNDLLVRKDEVEGREFGDLLWNRLAVRNLHTRTGLREMIQTLGHVPMLDQRDQQRAMEQTQSASQNPPTRPTEIDRQEYSLPIENPPYIDQPLGRRATLDEIGSKALLFKSPPDAYRPGFYESLFPNATVTYVHLTRGMVQTVNGLMDGWSKNEVDFISNPVGLVEADLAVKGYSVSDIARAYWCFDLFPGWKSYADAPLVEVCAQQWLRAHRNIIDNFPVEGRVTFESFYTHRGTFYEGIEAATGIDLRGYDWSEEVMTTEPPSQFRWLKREQLFRNIGEYLTARTFSDVVEMQENLGYSMEASTWH